MECRFMAKAGALVILLIGTTMIGSAVAGPLWYNGDWDNFSALANERNTLVPQSRIYDDFVITDPAGWDIDQVFSNDFVTPGVSFIGADFEIRQGLSAGNGGVVVASGLALAVSQTATGVPNSFGLSLDTFTISALNIHLNPGTYWLNVTPVDTGEGRSFAATTSGDNAVGVPAGNNGNAFWNSALFSQNFSSTVVAEGAGFHDFSEGVNGRVSVATVPEPATLVLLIAGFAGLAFFGLRKPSQAVPPRRNSLGAP
jgi:hypothetical protein